MIGIPRPRRQLSDSEIALLSDIGGVDPDAETEKGRMLRALIAEGYLEPVSAAAAAPGVKYQITRKAQELLISRGAGLNES